VATFDPVSTERAELEEFAIHAIARRPMATPGGDAVHNVAVLNAVLESARSGRVVAVS
jgi:hypothetical protein